ncbi:MAG: FkbM family methyltransferase [Rubrivivax sp.]|nr:FkbM family methyltransferase [Rubrivivax sp.]
MSFASFVFSQAVGSRGLSRRVWIWVRRALVRWAGDPVCKMAVHGRMLNINLSHALPGYQARHPMYDSLPRRLGEFLRTRHGAVVGIDVGANVGDTVAAFIGGAQDRFLAVEPNPKFFRILQSNWADDDRVTIIDTICSSSSQEGHFAIRERNGTASIVPSANGTDMAQRPLDEIVIAHSTFARCNLIKVDTDGHDFEVLDGAAGVIGRNRPTVLFECDSFGRRDYIETVLRTLDMFRRSGYRRYLVYDNFGFLMGCHELDNHQRMKDLLFYQLISEFNYYDLLVLPETDFNHFHESEVALFSGS